MKSILLLLLLILSSYFQQLESNKMAALSAQMQKIEDASRKKDEQTNQFIVTTREALEQKMEVYGTKREAYITDLKTKLKVIFVYNNAFWW